MDVRLGRRATLEIKKKRVFLYVHSNVYPALLRYNKTKIYFIDLFGTHGEKQERADFCFLSGLSGLCKWKGMSNMMSLPKQSLLHGNAVFLSVRRAVEFIEKAVSKQRTWSD